MDSPICHCGTCNACVPTAPEEHRGSRMPEGVTPIDPTFYDAALRGFRPETPDQAEALQEKAGPA